MAAEPAVRAGHVLALRLFDIAYEIDLPRAEALWAAEARTASSRARLLSTPPKAVAFGVPPLTLALEPVELTLDGTTRRAGITARLYDFGAVVLALRLPVAALPWSAYVRVLNALDQTVGPNAPSRLWQDLLARVCGIIGGAVQRPARENLVEDYLIGVVNEFDERLTAAQALERLDIPALLSGEERRLSETARADLLRQRFSYYEDDLVVLTWDRAFVYEPRGESDVADVLEVANAQLLEMRYYDELLDAELPRMYDLVEMTRRRLDLFASRRYADLARRLYTLVAEVTELTEKVDNALQVTEDVYLARIYAAALELFRVRLVSAAVDRKLSIMRDTYAALYEEASGSRAALMEAAVVVLIVLEIFIAVFHW